jgi:phospholipid/cholesterol/gamma-HCH transport system permease protein
VSTPQASPQPAAAASPRGPKDGGSETAEVLEEAGEASARFVGQAVVNIFAYLGELMVLLGQSLRVIGRLNAGDLVRQMSVIGVDTIPIALMTVGFSGAVLALYTTNTLAQYGVSSLVGGIVGLSIVRETGPILAGVVCAARAGSAMTAEIGSMKVTEQIDALRSMSISPTEYLVTPRVVASLIMLPILTICADAAGVFGGAIVASGLGVSFDAYLASMRSLMMPDGSDIFKGLIKTIVFGVIVALIGCREGLQTEGGAVGVGQSTTRSVVLSIVLVFAANFILSFILFNSGMPG